MSSIKKVMNNFARNAELDEYLKNEIGDAGYGGVEVLKSPVGTKITLFVSRPGIVIGRRGIGIRSLTENIESMFKLQNPQISVLEIEVPELIPQVMCNRIAHNVRRGTAFRRASLWALNSIMNAGALGAEISVAGKLRSERAHHEKHRAGIVLKSGETAKRVVREASSDVLLKMGLYGIKVKIAIKDAIPPEVEIKEDIEKETDTKSIEKEKPSSEIEDKPKPKKPVEKKESTIKDASGEFELRILKKETDAKSIEKKISSPEVEIKEDIQKETDVKSIEKKISSPEVEIKEDIQKETDAKPIEVKLEINGQPHLQKKILATEVEIKSASQELVKKKKYDTESVIRESTKSKTNADKKIEVKPRKSNVRKGKRTKSDPKTKLDKKIVRRKVEGKEKETKDEKSKK
jgi:small subunit ribosomal protein S3